MKAVVIEETKILTPNKEHKNFTETDKTIPKGEVIEGEVKMIEGLRRGEPFTYRVFVTTDNNVVYLDKIKLEMEETYNADSGVTPTVVNLTPAEMFSKLKFWGLLAGSAVGYYYAKKKGYDTKKTIMTMTLAGSVGLLSGYIFDKSRDVVITKSK